MRQAIHIFRKDVRHCWPYIAGVVAITAAHAWQASVDTPLPENYRLYTSDSLIALLMVLAWWLAIGAAVRLGCDLLHLLRVDRGRALLLPERLLRAQHTEPVIHLSNEAPVAGRIGLGIPRGAAVGDHARHGVLGQVLGGHRLEAPAGRLGRQAFHDATPVDDA